MGAAILQVIMGQSINVRLSFPTPTIIIIIIIRMEPEEVWKMGGLARDGTVETVTRDDTKFSGANEDREIIIILATSEQDWHPYPCGRSLLCYLL